MHDGARAFPILNAPTARGLAGRAFVLWLIVRITFSAFALLAGGAAALAPGPFSSLALVGATAFLNDVDVRATREALFLAHIGIGRRHIAGIAGFIASAGEAALLLAAGAIR